MNKMPEKLINEIKLRPLTADDALFAYRVYASTRADEMKLVNWDDAQKEAFVQMQFKAQSEHYQLHYPDAEYLVIQYGELPAGRLIVERSENSIVVMDLALLPEYRNLGIGGTLLRDLMSEAEQKGVPVVLRVEFFNPVIRLYTRLGFVKTRQINDVYHEMVWNPPARSTT